MGTRGSVCPLVFNSWGEADPTAGGVPACCKPKPDLLTLKLCLIRANPFSSGMQFATSEWFGDQIPIEVTQGEI